MKEKITTKHANFGWYLLVLIITAPAFFSLLRSGFFPMQDDLQAFRIHQMHECFADFQFPCRWVPDMGYQYGYPQFNFYAPFVYYVGEFIHLAGFQFIDTVKILFLLGFVFSAWAMFILAKEFFGKIPAVFAALIYTFAPYKAAQVYVRGSLSEFWSLVFFPLILWLLYKLVTSESRKFIIAFAATFAALLLTHNLLPVIFAPVCIVWLMYWLIVTKNIAPIKKVVIGGFFGVGLAAFFLLPMIFERQYVHIDSVLTGYFDYRRHFVSLRQMFLSNTWGYGSSDLGEGDEVALYSGIIHLVVAAAAGILALIQFTKDRKKSAMIFLLLSTELIVLFMMHLKSSLIWSEVAFLKWLQFPWRFLTISILLLSFLGSAALSYLPKKTHIPAVFLVGAALLLLHGSFFMPRDWYYISDKDKFSGQSWERQLTISIFDYLPIYATLPPTQKAPDLPEVLEGEAVFSEYRKESNKQSGLVKVVEDATIRFPIFDFPGMKLTVDGKEVTHSRDNCVNQPHCLGLVAGNIPKGEHSVEVKLVNTAVRTIGNTISLLSMLALLFIGIKYEKRKKI